jgi:hypothetical protein
MSDYQEPTIPCKYCSKPTPMICTQLCNRCWELSHRIDSVGSVALARMILDEFPEFQIYLENPDNIVEFEQGLLKVEKAFIVIFAAREYQSRNVPYSPGEELTTIIVYDLSATEDLGHIQSIKETEIVTVT